MMIDCGTCTVRGAACADCVVTVLLQAPPARAGSPRVVTVDEVEATALSTLAAAGLVPGLRHPAWRAEGPEPAACG